MIAYDPPDARLSAVASPHRTRRARWLRIRAGRLAQGLSPAAGRETLDAETREVERVMLEARLVSGLAVSTLGEPGRHAVAGLIAGEWSHRGTGEGVDPRVSVQRSVMRSAMKASKSSRPCTTSSVWPHTTS